MYLLSQKSRAPANWKKNYNETTFLHIVSYLKVAILFHFACNTVFHCLKTLFYFCRMSVGWDD